MCSCPVSCYAHGSHPLQVDGKAIKHPYSKHLTLLSTDNPKNNVCMALYAQLCACGCVCVHVF